jgi:hypothetical protein
MPGPRSFADEQVFPFELCARSPAINIVLVCSSLKPCDTLPMLTSADDRDRSGRHSGARE